MGIIVRLLGTGIGLAAEAVNHRRSRSRSPNPETEGQSSSSAPQAPPAMRSQSDQPPEYVEVADAATAEKLVRSGKAEYPDEKKALAHHDDDDDDSDSDTTDSDLDVDEAAWQLDDLADDVAPPNYADSEAAARELAAAPEEAKAKKEDDMVRELARLAGPPPQPSPRLACPVIIPQRRPRQKDRGFVRAYAPVLSDSGISQDVFLRFMKDWFMASKASPWIDVVFIAAGIAGFVPDVAAQVVSTVVQIAAGTARELQSRSRRNTFLDRANEELFMPRGLFAMVMAFKDDVDLQQTGPLSRLAGKVGQAFFTTERLDLQQTAAKFSNPDPNLSGMRKNLQKIRLVNGKTQGQLELPEAAPLVYPAVDRAAERDLEETAGKGKDVEKSGVKDKWKGASKFVQDYLDRRSQALYEHDHPDSSLSVPSSQRQPFSSRYADPNHPANSGSLVALLTGGALNPRQHKMERRARRNERKALRREYKDARREAHGRAPRERRPLRDPDPRRRPKKGIRKLLQQDVLYFVIVNLPTRAEVDEGVASLERILTERGE